MSIITFNDLLRSHLEVAKHVLISMRPYQWVKNILVFAALFFSLSFTDLTSVLLTLLAFAAFCMVSSSIYLFNDIRDKEADRLHPVKKNRPIAAGKISTKTALVYCLLFLAVGIYLASRVNLPFLLIILLYLFLNLGYSLGLKEVVLLDVMIVAIGFLLRAVGGAFAIEVAVSPWLFICTLLLALLLVFGKRRHELSLMESAAGSHRKSLSEYSLPFLDGVMFVSAGAAIVTYSLYTMTEEVMNRFHTEWLVATTPLVIYGVFRYLYLIYVKKEGGDPTKIVITDKPFLINAILWAMVIILLLVGSRL